MSAGGILAAVIELRIRLFWHRLRGRGGLAEGIATAALFLLAIPMSLVFAALVGAGSYQAARAGRGPQVEATVAGVFFGLWQAWTAVSLSLNDRDGLDLRRFLVYPVPTGRIYLFGLASGIAGDPMAVFWVVLLCGQFVGAALGRPGTWLAALAADQVLFAAATVFLVALVQELLAHILRSRRVREVAIVAAALAIPLLLLAAASGPGGVRDALQLVVRLRWIFFPPALSAAAASHFYSGEIVAGLPYLVLLAVATAATGWAAFRLGLAGAMSGGEGAVAAPRRTRPRWRLGRGRFGALVEKEAKYLLRHPLARVYVLILPAFAALVAWKVAPAIPAEAGNVVRALPLLGFVLYDHLVLQIFWLNGFGWERGGMRAYWLAPLPLEDVLAAKNVALYGFSLAVFALSAAVMMAVGGSPPAWALASALALHAALAPVLYGLGNVVAILNPRAAPFGVQRGGSLPNLSGLAGMAILSGACSVFAVPVLVALRLESPWLVPASWTFFGFAGLFAYWRTLPAAAELLDRRREQVLAVVCGDDA